MCINKNMTKMISELNFLSLETYVLEILFRNPCVRSLMFFDPLDDLRETLPGDTIYQDNDTSGAVAEAFYSDFKIFLPVALNSCLIWTCPGTTLLTSLSTQWENGRDQRWAGSQLSRCEEGRIEISLRQLPL